MTPAKGIEIRPLREDDLPEAALCNRTAFAAFLGLPGPDHFRPGADVIGPRFRAWPEGCIVLTENGNLAGQGLMMRWGSVVVLGPLTVFPEHWGKGYARQLMAALLERIEAAGIETVALFTHPQSPTHVRLYESFGFVLQRITAIMTKDAENDAMPHLASVIPSDDEGAVARLAEAARPVTGTLHPGLDVTSEILALARENCGELLCLADGDGAISAFAICHHGPWSEASAGQYYVKFACAAPGPDASNRLANLLQACESRAVALGAETVVAGTNTGRSEAYEVLKGAGFRTIINGAAMMRPAGELYNRPGALALDDWR